MKVLITGANGMLAREMIKICSRIGDDVFAFAHSALDISDFVSVNHKITEVKPQIVFNCAAFTNVDVAENEPEKAFSANAKGVENLAKACKISNAKFVTVSTDYVFDGEKSGFYYESDTPTPISKYGESKAEGEKLALASNSNTIVVRSGWIFGENGTNFLSVIPRLITENKELTAISDAYGTPTYALHLAKKMREIAATGFSGIIHIANEGNGASYYDYAVLCEGILKTGCRIKPCLSDDLKRAAPRPRSSKLASKKESGLPMPNWQEALREFLQI